MSFHTVILSLILQLLFIMKLKIWQGKWVLKITFTDKLETQTAASW